MNARTVAPETEPVHVPSTGPGSGDPVGGTTGEISTGHAGEITTRPCTVPSAALSALHPNMLTRAKITALAAAAFLIIQVYAGGRNRSRDRGGDPAFCWLSSGTLRPGEFPAMWCPRSGFYWPSAVLPWPPLGSYFGGQPFGHAPGSGPGCSGRPLNQKPPPPASAAMFAKRE